MADEPGTPPKFGPTDFLRALQTVTTFDAASIREAVLRSAGRLHGDALPHETTRQPYTELLRDMRYIRLKLGDRPPKDSLHIIPKFDTPRMEWELKRPATRDPITVIITTHILNTLHAYGFGQEFSRIILTDDVSYIVNSHPATAEFRSDPRWSHLLITRPPHEQAGGLMSFGPTNHEPTLFIRVPPRGIATLDTLQIINSHLVHELVHYFLYHCIFRHDVLGKIYDLFSLAGQAVGGLALILLGECYAHIETGRLQGRAYLNLAPSTALSREVLTEDSPGPLARLNWLSRRIGRWLAMLDFVMRFPWFCAAVHRDDREMARRILESFPEREMRQLILDLCPKMFCFYHTAEITGDLAFDVLNTLDKRDCLPFVDAWADMSEFISDHPTLFF